MGFNPSLCAKTHSNLFNTCSQCKKGCHVHASQAVATCHLIPLKSDKNLLKLNSSIYMNCSLSFYLSVFHSYFRGDMTESYIIQKSNVLSVYDVVTIFHKGLVSAFTLMVSIKMSNFTNRIQP